MQAILASKKEDWIYLIGSSLSGFILIGFYYALMYSDIFSPDLVLIITFVLFSLFFDVRHLFATYSRTFLDKSYYQTHKRWLWSSLFWVLFIPLGLFFLFAKGSYAAFDSGIITLFAIRMTLVLGFYHLIKQNWGFVAIYKKKNGEQDEGRWEKALLLSGSFLPLVFVAYRDYIWYPSEQIYFEAPVHQLAYLYEKWHLIAFFCLGLSILFALFGFIFKVKAHYKYVSRNLSFFFFGAFILIECILQWGVKTLIPIVVIMAFIFFYSLLKVWKQELQRKLLSREKWAVVIGSLILYWGVILLPLENKLVVVMAITIPHNIQYLQFVQFFQKKQYSQSIENHGFAKRVLSKTGLFFVVSFVYAFIFEAGRTGIKFMTLSSNSDKQFFWQNAIIMFFIGLVLHHYYTDAVIWRVRKDNQIKNIV